MKKTVGILSLFLAFIIAVNSVTPVLSESISDYFSMLPKTGAFNHPADEASAADGENAAEEDSDLKEAAYDDGKILIYNFDQLSMIGSGKSYEYDDGVTAIYAMDAEYKLARDISLPRHTLWQLPEGFSGKITGDKQEQAPLYDRQTDRIYVYHPYQLAVMAMEDADSQPVMDGDAEAASFGSGKVICTDEENKHYLTYSGEHNYVISAAFDSDISQKPLSVSKSKSKSKNSADDELVGEGEAEFEGRDFAGQVVKKIGTEKYILIGNQEQLRAIGTDKDVLSPVYQVDYVAWTGFVVDKDSDGKPIRLYGGDADLLESQNGYDDFSFQSIHTTTGGSTGDERYYSGVNQNTGEPYLDATRTTTDLNSATQASWKTGETYSAKANYIIFRDIDLEGASNAWKPLMFSGTMYGAKTSGGKLWDGDAIGNATKITATAEANRPIISNVYVKKDSTLNVNDYIGIGFFATISNKADSSNLGVSGGQAIVKNLDLHDVHVENNATETGVDETLLNLVTENLGKLVGGLLDVLLRLLSFGSASTDLSTTLSNLLNARANDPTVFATGAFAGRIYGDVLVEDCRVSGQVTVSNVKDRTGGFVGYTEGMTEYSGLSRALGAVSTFLSSVLNVIPAVGLGDLVTILLDNALPVGNLIPTDYIAPKIVHCEASGLMGDIGKTTTNFAGGFVGQQIGTCIEDCSVTSDTYTENGETRNTTFAVRAKNYGGGFCGLARDAEIKGTLDGVGIDWSSIIKKIHPQSVLMNCSIEDVAYTVTGESYLGGFVGVLNSSYAVDCKIDCGEQPLDIHGTDNCIGGFAGYATVGWTSSLGKDENHEKSLLGTVRQILTGLLSTDASTGQQLLTLMGVSPSAILGCQIYSDSLTVTANQNFAGGILGKGDGVMIGTSNQASLDELAKWNSGTLLDEARDRPVILDGLTSVTTRTGDFAGGVAGYVGSAAFQGLLNDVVGLGDFIGFSVSDVTVTGVDGGYTVKAGNYNAGGGFGLAVGGTVKNVHLNKLKSVEAYNRAAGFVGIAGPGALAGTGALTVNLLGLDKVLEVSNLLSIGQGMEVHIDNSTVTGINSGFVVEATGTNSGEDVFDFTAAGFIADSNSTKITNSHTYNLLSVTATDSNGFAGGFIGTSETGGLAEAANNDATGLKDKYSSDGVLNINGLLKAVGYLIPSYIDCTTTYVDDGYVQADIAGGFVANMASGTVDNSVTKLNLTGKPDRELTAAEWTPVNIAPWTRTMRKVYDPDAVEATGDPDKQFAVFNIGSVKACTFGGGFGGRVVSGALAKAGGGVSILGNTGLNISLDDLAGVLNVYVPNVRNAGVYSENGFTVEAEEVRSGESASGSAGGFAGYTSGAQISNSDVYQLKRTEVKAPAILETANAPTYFDESTYAVTGGAYAGGYVGNMDIGSAASVGNGLKVLGETIQLTNIASALSVVVTTIEHSDVQGMGGGFSVRAGKPDVNGNVGKSGGFAGEVSGGHIQNSHCKNFYYIIGMEAAGGYVGNMKPGNVAKLLDNGSILDPAKLLGIDSALATLVEDFVPTIRNSTTSCVPCGGVVRAQAASDDAHQRGCAGGYCGHNEGGHIWGLNTKVWKNRDFTEDPVVRPYEGERHIATAWRIRSVYGAEYAGGFTGYMESADTADTGNVKLLGGLIQANNLLSALKLVYPTEETTAVYGPLRNIDVLTWNAWVEFVGKKGGFGAQLAQGGAVSIPDNPTEEDISEAQATLDGKIDSYIYGCTVVAGRTSHDAMTITEGGNAGGYVGYMKTGVITNGQTYDIKYVRAMRSAGGYAGKMQTGGAADFGSVSLLGLNLNLGQMVNVAQVLVPTVKSGTVHGWQSGMTVTSYGAASDKSGYAGGYVGSSYGAQIWGDKNVGDTAGTGCNVENLRYVKGATAAGGYVGIASSASVADVDTHASDGFLQGLLNSLISTPADLVNVLQATISTIRDAEVNADSSDFGFTVDGVRRNEHPRFAGGFAGSLEATVVNSRKGDSSVTVNNLRSVDGQYYAGGFVGLADVGSVASVSSPETGSTSILNLVDAGGIDVLGIFRTYIYDSTVNGVSDGLIVNAYESAPSGILSETRYSGCAGGFGGGVMNGAVNRSVVTNLNKVSAPNYTGGFIGHMGKNGAVNVNDASIRGLLGASAGILDLFGTTVESCRVTGISDGAMISASEGEQPIAGGFAGYADLSRIRYSTVSALKQVYSDQIAGGFVGKTNMAYLVSAEVDSPLVQLILGIVNSLLKILLVPNLENIGLINTDAFLSGLGISNLLGLKVLSDGDLLYVNLLGLRVGVSLVKKTGESTGTALVTIGDSTVELPYNENGIDTSGENAEVVVNLIKGNRTLVDNCNTVGITTGYDVYGGGSSNKDAATDTENGYAGGFVGYNYEGKFTSNKMEYCDVIRGADRKVGPFSGETYLKSSYSFNTLDSIEKVNREENHYSIYRNTDLTYALTSNDIQIGKTGVKEEETGYMRFDVTHLAAPIRKGDNETGNYYEIYQKYLGAKLASSSESTGRPDSNILPKPLDVYASGAKVVLMLDNPTKGNAQSIVPNPGEQKDPCKETIDLTIQKIWKDDSNKDKTRPGQIKVRILQNGSVLIDRSLVPDMDDEGWFTITESDHGRDGSATWTRVIEGLPVYTTVGESIVYYEYTVEEDPIIGYKSKIDYDKTGETATATIVNEPEPFEIVFKYYDRYEIDGSPAGINEEETAYTIPLKTIPKDFVRYDDNYDLKSVDFKELIGEEAVEFSEKLAVNNVMCEYELWTSQKAALEAMKSRTYIQGGTKLSYAPNERPYHTNYLGAPFEQFMVEEGNGPYHHAQPGEELTPLEKWVNYYDSEGNPLEERFDTPEDYRKVRKIVVWCNIYPKTYNVDVYGADSGDDLLEMSLDGKKIYVADRDSVDDKVKLIGSSFYYNQRFGVLMNNPAQDDPGFIGRYGLSAIAGVNPSTYAKEEFDGYSFAYWAYDQEGTRIASVDRGFQYRVTNHTKIYAVYVKDDEFSEPGISVSANQNDTFVDEKGISRTRLNILASVYGAAPYDKKVEKLSFVNISLSKQIRDNPEIYTPQKVNELFMQYKDQLKTMIEDNDSKNGSSPFTVAKTYTGDIDLTSKELNSELQVTLTTKGFIYTVSTNGNPVGPEDATIELSNRNRAQFTYSYKTSALNVNGTGSNGNTCLVYCGAVRCSGKWSVSTNCLLYFNGKAVENTEDAWPIA